MSGTLTFPGEPPDPVAIRGTYKVQGDQVELMTPDGSGLWRLRFGGEEVSLTLEGSAPPTSMTLRRLPDSQASAFSRKIGWPAS